MRCSCFIQRACQSRPEGRPPRPQAVAPYRQRGARSWAVLNGVAEEPKTSLLVALMTVTGCAWALAGLGAAMAESARCGTRFLGSVTQPFLR
jgi:hypothetical protein